MGEIKVFEPSARDMKAEFPELAEIEEFKNLSNRDLKFVWYLSNQTSPLVGLDTKCKIEEAIEICYNGKLPDAEKERYFAGSFSDEILKAINRMAMVDPMIRVQAKYNIEYIFGKLQKIIVITDDELNELEADEKKKYAELAIKIANEMPNLVSLMERKFGIKKKRDKKEVSTEVSVGDVMDEIV